jgi:hypothetical protein
MIIYAVLDDQTPRIPSFHSMESPSSCKIPHKACNSRSVGFLHDFVEGPVLEFPLSNLRSRRSLYLNSDVLSDFHVLYSGD